MSAAFKAALIQTCSGENPATNIPILQDLIRGAHQRGAQFILTPEVSNAIDLDRARLKQRLGEGDDDAAVHAFAQLAAELKIYLLAGSFALKVGDKLVNRSMLFAPDGQVQAAYDKMHMFDVDLPNGERYRESNGYHPGHKAVVTDLPWGRLGMTVCYDIRFPSLYRHLAQAGAVFLSIPSAFTRPTGRAHWETLLRARAIETGCYVFAPAQAGDHESGRKTYGHSMVVAPWGEIIAEAGTDAPEIITADIDPAAVTAARQKIPALQHDRAFSVTHDSQPVRAAS